MIWSGFVIGLLGSLHCVGMCGPLAFAAPTMPGKRLTGALVYNAGRTMTYALLGAIAGILGLGINLAGFQSYLSIATGVFIIMLVIFPLIERALSKASKFDLSGKVRTAISTRLRERKGSTGAVLSLGILNGLLPCGLIYAALAGAIETGTVETAALYMVLFGLGTSALMITAMLSRSWVQQLHWLKPKKVVPYLTLLLGIMFITRGVLYLRPADAPQTATIDFLQTITMCHVE